MIDCFLKNCFNSNKAEYASRLETTTCSKSTLVVALGIITCLAGLSVLLAAGLNSVSYWGIESQLTGGLLIGIGVLIAGAGLVARCQSNAILPTEQKNSDLRQDKKTTLHPVSEFKFQPDAPTAATRETVSPLATEAQEIKEAVQIPSAGAEQLDDQIHDSTPKPFVTDIQEIIQDTNTVAKPLDIPPSDSHLVQKDRIDLLVQTDPATFDSLPTEILKLIFQQLNLREQWQCSQVNRRWNVILSIELSKALCLKFWNTLGTIGEIPPIPSYIIEAFNQPCPFIPGKKRGATHCLMLMPSEVDGKALTSTRLHKLTTSKKRIGFPPNAFRTSYRYRDKMSGIDVEIKHDISYLDIPVKKSYWVLVFKDIIPDSKKMNPQQQIELLKSYKVYQMPRTIEIAACVFMRFSSSKEILFNKYAPGTYKNVASYATVVEKNKNGWLIGIGAFDGKELEIDAFYPGESLDRGMGAVIRCES